MIQGVPVKTKPIVGQVWGQHWVSSRSCPQMALKDTVIRSAKPKDKSYRLFDSDGLYLEINPKGNKWWRWKYRFGGKEKRLSVGVYPSVSLKQARLQKDDLKKQLHEGKDPSFIRKVKKFDLSQENNFEAIAREWHENFKPRWTESHAIKIMRLLERDIFPWLGPLPINTIKPPEILPIIRRIEKRGSIDTAHRAKQNCGQIFRYAVATGRCEFDPTTSLNGALPSVKGGHFASIKEPKKVGELLRAIDAYQGALTTQSALKLAPLVFVRPGELRHASWDEIDFERAEWRIPAEKMKMRVQLIVPLCTQAIEILKELKPVTDRVSYANPAKVAKPPRFVFPSLRTIERPMSENAILVALRSMGYSKEEMTGHGFRSMASTLLHELGWNHQVIERQLAHAERNAVSAAYNFAEHLPERKKMMQAWADYLDQLKNEMVREK